MRHILYSLVFLLTCSVAHADLPNRQELTELIWSERDEEARAAIVAWVSDYEASNVAADDLRNIFIGLSRSHTKTQQFLTRWISDETDNPIPKIARAWALWNASGTLGRGGTERSVGLAWDLYYEARDLAARAYRENPNLIPASDAVIRGLTDGLLPVTRHDEIQRILVKDANWGSIHRYITSFADQKMTYDGFLKMCTHLSGFMPEDTRQATIHQCIMSAGADWNFAWLNEYGKRFYRADPSTEMALINAYTFATKVDLTEADADDVLWAHNTVLSSEFNPFQLHLLRTVSTRLAISPAAQALGLNTRAEFLLQNRDAAEALLDRDPFNEALIDFLEEATDLATSRAFNEACRRTAVTEPCRLTFEEQDAFRAKARIHRGEIALARLRANPWAPKYWEGLANHLYGDPLALFEGDLALENAAALSDEPLHIVNQILARKIVQLSSLQDIEHNLDIAPPEYRQQLANADIVGQIHCPFLRAYRYRAFLCQASSDQKCSPHTAEDEAMISAWHTLLDLAEKEPACQNVLASAGSDLSYTLHAYKDVLDGQLRFSQGEPR